MSPKTFGWEWRGETERKAANKRRIIKPVTTVGSGLDPRDKEVGV